MRHKIAIMIPLLLYWVLELVNFMKISCSFLPDFCDTVIVYFF